MRSGGPPARRPDDASRQREPERLDRSRWELVFEDGFAGGVDPSRWVDHYPPHWTTPERSAARYAVGDGGLTLRIDADQPAWLPEDGDGLRVSNLQTGTFSGPTRRLWTPAAGLVEATVSASADPTCMLAVWLVGLFEVPASAARNPAGYPKTAQVHGVRGYVPR